jgi:hypothetical protein
MNNHLYIILSAPQNFLKIVNWIIDNTIREINFSDYKMRDVRSIIAKSGCEVRSVNLLNH